MIQSLFQNFSLASLQNLIILIVVFLFSISFHEFSHAYRANKLGDDTAAKQGRLTLNPIVHLDPIGTLVLVVSGRIGWAKPVPINPVLFTRAKTMKRGIIEVSLAGPLSNFFLAFISYFLLNTVLLIYIIAAGENAQSNFLLNVIIELLSMMVFLNVFLGIFNLFPIPPLDGFKIFGSLLPDNMYYKLMGYERYIGLIFIALIIFGGGIFGRVLNFVATPFFFIIRTPIDWVFKFLGSLV